MRPGLCPFPPSAACRFLDLPPVNLRNLHLHLTKNPFAGQPPHLCGVTLRIAAPEIRRGDSGCQKPTESSRGPKPSRLLIEPGGVYGGCGRIFAAENPIFQSKNRFLADFAPGDFEEILAKSGRGGEPGGIRTHGLSLRRTRVVLFVHLVSFDFLSFHLDLSRNSASFPKRPDRFNRWFCVVIPHTSISRVPTFSDSQKASYSFVTAG